MHEADLVEESLDHCYIEEKQIRLRTGVDR